MRQHAHADGGSAHTSVGAGGARLDRAAKRLLDLVGAVLLLVALTPLLLAVAVAIKLDSRGSVLYRCRRVGYHGRELWMLKFRKMRHDAAGPSLTLDQDDRFTRVGRVLAKLKLDELPQLWNVIKGEMSLVGPRPESDEFVDLHRERYETILRVRPGITGLCQLAFAKEGRILDPANRVTDYRTRLLPQKVAVDEFYASSRTLRMDVSILLWTFIAVVGRFDVAVHRATGALTRRRRPAPAEALAPEAGAS